MDENINNFKLRIPSKPLFSHATVNGSKASAASNQFYALFKASSFEYGSVGFGSSATGFCWWL